MNCSPGSAGNCNSCPASDSSSRYCPASLPVGASTGTSANVDAKSTHNSVIRASTARIGTRIIQDLRKIDRDGDEEQASERGRRAGFGDQEVLRSLQYFGLH